MGVKGALSTTTAILTHTIIAFNVNIVNSIIKYMKTFKIKPQQISKRINNIKDCPQQLYIKTKLENPLDLFSQPTVAVVGSRKLTSYGKIVTEKIVNELVINGVTIVSGLALGVDSVAHAQALKSGGSTIAVLPSGVNSVYPRSHQNLAEKICQKGALISEYKPEEAVAYKQNFIARNRIIAGLSDAIIITEAAKGSGSLHTANFGIDLGIDIYAVPGNITSPSSEGVNALIKNGAFLLDNTKDLLDDLGLNKKTSQRQLPLVESKEQQLIVNVLADGSLHYENILNKTGLSANQLNSSLSYLEIMGIVRNIGNNNWDLN